MTFSGTTELPLLIARSFIHPGVVHDMQSKYIRAAGGDAHACTAAIWRSPAASCAGGSGSARKASAMPRSSCASGDGAASAHATVSERRSGKYLLPQRCRMLQRPLEHDKHTHTPSPQRGCIAHVGRPHMACNTHAMSANFKLYSSSRETPSTNERRGRAW